MKNTKIMAIAIGMICSLMTFSSTIHAVANFELYNKANKEITVTMKVGTTKKQVFRIPAGYAGQRNITDNQPVYLLIQEEPGISVNIYKKILPTDKTKYITFTPGKSPNVYPQTGPYMGLMRKTESGLSLSNNIDKGYIQEGSMSQIVD
jgi:hypothetical protein